MSALLAAIAPRGVATVPVARTEPAAGAGRTADGSVAVTLEGSVDNARMMQALLESKGYEFDADPAPDGDVLARLVHHSHKRGRLLFHAVREAVAALAGRYALVAAAASEPDCIVVAQRGRPLVIGVGAGEQAVACDEEGLPYAMGRCIHLEEGDVAELRGNDLVIVNAHGQAVLRKLQARGTPAQAA